MKRNHAPDIIPPGFDPEAPAELTMFPDWNHGKAFVIRDIGSNLIGLAETAATEQVAQVPAPAPKQPQKASESLTAVYVEPSKTDRIKQYFADAHVRRFDKAHGSNLYGELLAQRRRDALFLKASQIGLLGTDSDYYKAKLKKLAKATVQA